MQTSLISIIIPTYNSSLYIKRLISSLLSQTYSNWEAIVVDNNSEDDTIELLHNYIDSRIRIYNINNEGVIAKSRNFGISKSKGEWIAFLDSDDWWDSNKLEFASNFFEDDIDLIYHKLMISTEETESTNKYLYYRKTNNVFKDLLIHGNFISNSSVMIRSDIIKKVGKISENINLVGAEDYNYLLKVTNHTNKIKFINKKLGFYYMNPNGVSRKKMSICHIEAISEFLTKITKLELNYIKGHIAYMDANFLFINNDYINSLKTYKKAIYQGTIRIKAKAIIGLLKCIFKCQ